MRVQIMRKDYGISVIEVIQMLQYNEKTIGLVMPYSQRLEKRKYDSYESTTPVDEADFNRWCEQLVRTGYLDLTRTDLEFKATYAK